MTTTYKFASRPNNAAIAIAEERQRAYTGHIGARVDERAGWPNRRYA